MGRLSIPEILLRILMAFVAGGVVGWEREGRGRPAGLRTTILACMASAIVMMVSQILWVDSAAASGSAAWRPDPGRLGAGILTGFGFLGAATILRHENIIRGVTTAASLWFVTVLGLAFGSGQFALGFIGVALALITLLWLPWFERNVRSDWYSTLTVTASLEALAEAELKNRIEAFGPKVVGMKLTYDLEKRQKTLACDVRLKRPGAFELSSQVVADLVRCPGVLQVMWV